MTRARPQADQALAVPAGPVARPSPSGFDPSRCRNCGGDGWVCENHPDAPWNDSMNFGCECGAGMPCGACNLEMASAGYSERERIRVLRWLQALPKSYSGWNDFDEHFDNGHASAVCQIISGIEKREDVAHAIAMEARQGTDPKGLDAALKAGREALAKLRHSGDALEGEKG